jgi:hypothetical protein
MNGKLAALLAGLLLIAAPMANADDSSATVRPAQAAVFELALGFVERGLEANPDDPQMRLLQGHFLAKLGRSRESIAVLEKLARDHPELAEPDWLAARNPIPEEHSKLLKAQAGS